MNIIFLGNSKYSTIVETALQETFGLTCVVTIPDKPQGRKKTLTPSPVKTYAQQHTVPVILADKLTDDIIDQIEMYKPDFLVVADYGLILPKRLLALPKYAPINVHHSLLPKYRGPAPAPYAILAGEKESGVTIIEMTNKVDAGDILSQEKYVLRHDETTDSLLIALNTIGARIIIPVITAYINNDLHKKEQDHDHAVFTKYMTKDEAYVDSTTPPSPDSIDRMMRAYYPWPGVWTKLLINGKEKIVKLLPGKMLQVEGKKAVAIKDFLNGYPELKSQVEKLAGNA
jgi:methionyl-tRNA formyltransferase